MTKKNNKDMDQARATLEKAINQKYKKSFRQQVEDLFSGILSIIFLIFCAIIVLAIVVGIFALIVTIFGDPEILLISILGIILIIVIGRRL